MMKNMPTPHAPLWAVSTAPPHSVFIDFGSSFWGLTYNEDTDEFDPPFDGPVRISVHPSLDVRKEAIRIRNELADAPRHVDRTASHFVFPEVKIGNPRAIVYYTGSVGGMGDIHLVFNTTTLKLVDSGARECFLLNAKRSTSQKCYIREIPYEDIVKQREAFLEQHFKELSQYRKIGNTGKKLSKIRSKRCEKLLHELRVFSKPMFAYYRGAAELLGLESEDAIHHIECLTFEVLGEDHKESWSTFSVNSEEGKQYRLKINDEVSISGEAVFMCENGWNGKLDAFI